MNMFYNVIESIGRLQEIIDTMKWYQKINPIYIIRIKMIIQKIKNAIRNQFSSVNITNKLITEFMMIFEMYQDTNPTYDISLQKGILTFNYADDIITVEVIIDTIKINSKVKGSFSTGGSLIEDQNDYNRYICPIIRHRMTGFLVSLIPKIHKKVL